MNFQWLKKILFYSRNAKGFDVYDQSRLVAEYSRGAKAPVGRTMIVEGPFIIEFPMIDLFKLGALAPFVLDSIQKQFEREVRSWKDFQLRNGTVVLRASWELEEGQPPQVRRAGDDESRPETDIFR